MKALHVWAVIGVVALFLGVPMDVRAGAGGEGDPVCLVMKNQIEDPRGVKLTGSVAVDATDVIGGVGDVVLRLERHGDTHFVRTQLLTSTFTAPTLLALQNRLCEILSIQQVINNINAAFGLSATKFVFTKRGIRDAEIDVDPNTLVVPGTGVGGVPPHAMTMADIVIFGQ